MHDKLYQKETGYYIYYLFRFQVLNKATGQSRIPPGLLNIAQNTIDICVTAYFAPTHQE
jgi:hypothetical protein